MNTRPSGASLSVVKRFSSADDFAKQCATLKAAAISGTTVPILDEDCAKFTLTMPFFEPRVPHAALSEVVPTFEKLWAVPAAPQRVCTRYAYHEYVMTREVAKLEGMTQREMSVAQTLHDNACKLADELYTPIHRWHVLENSFVHGDATLSNCVYAPDIGVRFIDLSPRRSPPEKAIDLAKLLFSAIGFDTDADVGEALFRNVHRSLPYRQATLTLVRYYYATHIVRVLAKEPPRTLERRDFYKKALEYVDQL